jgi:hypothetical protein
MTNDIVRKFVIREEGFPMEGDKARTYIPKKDGKAIGKSGLTFGGGIDIGQMDLKSFMKLGLPSNIQESLLPYVGKQGKDALAVERELGHFSLPSNVAMDVTNAHIDKSTNKVKDYFKGIDLSPEQLAVGTSLVHNYGDGALKFNTMNEIMKGDMTKGIQMLRDPNEWTNEELLPRRNREADLLENYYNNAQIARNRNANIFDKTYEPTSGLFVDSDAYRSKLDKRIMPTLGTANETQEEKSYRVLQAGERGADKGAQMTYGKIAEALTPNVDNIPDWMFTALRYLVGAEQPKQDNEQD